MLSFQKYHHLCNINHVNNWDDGRRALVRPGFGRSSYGSVKQINKQVDHSSKELVTKFTSATLQREGQESMQ